MKQFIRDLWDLLSYPYTRYMERRRFKKRMEELRKRDPFIYK